MNKKFKLEDIKIQSFVTSHDDAQGRTGQLKGGFTGNCGSDIGITCPEPCDFPSIPIDECTFGACTGQSNCICNTERFTCTCPV